MYYIRVDCCHSCNELAVWSQCIHAETLINRSMITKSFVFFSFQFCLMCCWRLIICLCTNKVSHCCRRFCRLTAHIVMILQETTGLSAAYHTARISTLIFIKNLGSRARLFQHTSLNCAHRCLNQPVVVTSVQLLGVTLQFHAPEQRDTARDVLLFLVQHSGIHSHCLFVIHH